MIAYPYAALNRRLWKNVCAQGVDHQNERHVSGNPARVNHVTAIPVNHVNRVRRVPDAQDVIRARSIR